MKGTAILPEENPDDTAVLVKQFLAAGAIDSRFLEPVIAERINQQMPNQGDTDIKHEQELRFLLSR